MKNSVCYSILLTVLVIGDICGTFALVSQDLPPFSSSSISSRQSAPLHETLLRFKRQEPAFDPLQLPQPQSSSLQSTQQEQQALIRQWFSNLLSSRYMPSQEQLTQLIVLLAVMALGPLAGGNVALIEGLVRQVVPGMLASAMGNNQQQQQPQFNGTPFNSNIYPVEPPRSPFKQTF